MGSTRNSRKAARKTAPPNRKRTWDMPNLAGRKPGFEGTLRSYSGRQNVFHVHPLRRVVAGIAGDAVALVTAACLIEAVKREIRQRISLDESPDLVYRLVGGNQVALRWRVNAVEAW